MRCIVYTVGVVAKPCRQSQAHFPARISFGFRDIIFVAVMSAGLRFAGTFILTISFFAPMA